MARVLVVHFSRSGATAHVAQQLARMLQADLEAVVEPRSRQGLRGYLRSGLEATSGRESSIGPAIYDPARYELVLLGTPVWNASLSSPMRAYLRRESSRLPGVCFFCTMGRRGSDRVFDQMEKLVGKKPLQTLALRARDVRRARGEEAMDACARFLERSLPNSAGSPVASAAAPAEVNAPVHS